MRYYRIHGLLLRSEIALAAADLENPDTAELTIKYGQRRAIPCQPKNGNLLALHEAAASGFALSEDIDGYTIRFYGLCDFELRRDFSELIVCLAPSADESITSILLSSNVLSCLLGLRGECVLHASALQIGSSAIGLVGPSGSGKSTLAAALCALGLPLITDDALRCSIDNEPDCYAGACEIRLRAEAKSLLTLFDDQLGTTSIDDRTVVHPKSTSLRRLPLLALVQPEFRQEPAIEIRRIHGSRAMLTLIAAGRISWWRAAELRRAQFRMLTELCKWVPVYALSLPRSAAFTLEGRLSIKHAILSVLLPPEAST